MRNLHTAVAAKHAPAVTAAVKTIFAHTDPDEVAAQWDRVADTLASSFPKVAAMLGEAKTDVLAFPHLRIAGSGPRRASSTRTTRICYRSLVGVGVARLHLSLPCFPRRPLPDVALQSSVDRHDLRGR